MVATAARNSFAIAPGIVRLLLGPAESLSTGLVSFSLVTSALVAAARLPLRAVGVVALLRGLPLRLRDQPVLRLRPFRMRGVVGAGLAAFFIGPFLEFRLHLGQRRRRRDEVADGFKQVSKPSAESAQEPFADAR